MAAAAGQLDPGAFSNVLDALYWSVMTVSTVGYGDTTPVTPGGKFLSCVIALAGIFLFALPAGIIGSGFVEVMQESKFDHDDEEHEQTHTQLVKMQVLIECVLSPAVASAFDHGGLEKGFLARPVVRFKSHGGVASGGSRRSSTYSWRRCRSRGRRSRLPRRLPSRLLNRLSRRQARLPRTGALCRTGGPLTVGVGRRGAAAILKFSGAHHVTYCHVRVHAHSLSY